MLMHILPCWTVLLCSTCTIWSQYSSSWPTVILWSHYRSHIYTGLTAEDWLHHNICVLCPGKWHVMHPLNVVTSCNDIYFNFNYIMVVMYGTSAAPVCKQISHQTHQHETAPQFHHMLMECCIYEIRMLWVTVWNELCFGVIYLCTESIRTLFCVGINLCL